MFSATWDRLWEMHDDVKDRLFFFVKPNAKVDKMVKQHKDTVSSNGNHGGEEKPPRTYTLPQLIGLILGPLFFIFTLLFFQPDDLSKEGVAILASTLWIATWWMTEALPIPVTSLLPIILFPLTRRNGSQSDSICLW